MTEKEIKSNIRATLAFVRERLFCAKTRLVYDRTVTGREAEFPTEEEARAAFPNPCGYSTGMEDGMISGATMLDACLLLYEKEGDCAAAEFARELACGMLDCAASARSEGFIPRALSPLDGHGHYPDSSRDQYTMFTFGMHRYMNSSLCTSAERGRITDIALAVARRAERNVTAENGYDMRTEEGGPTLATVLWGPTLGNHERMRLPMLYLFAFEASGDAYWLEKYREICEEAYEKSLPMGKYWALYTLQQMQASLLLCHEADPDAARRARYLSLMECVADYAVSLVPRVREKMNRCSCCNMPQKSFRDLPLAEDARFARLGYPHALAPVCADAEDYFALQDCAQLAIVTKTVPLRPTDTSVTALLQDALGKIDLATHERNLPVFFLDGLCRSSL